MNTLTRRILPAVILSVAAISPLQAQRIANLSTRTQVGTGINAPIMGFVVEAGAPKQILIRAAGPALSSFGLGGLLNNPRLEVFDSTGRSIASNDNWTTTSIGGATMFTTVGAFPFANGSRDAALLATLSAGSYTAQVTGVGTPNTGLALLEVYDVSGPARLINLSTRSMVGTGAGILISGVVVSPSDGARKLLVRAAGPALGAFGLTGVLADPSIAVLNSASQEIADNDNWESASAAALSAASTRAGAFAFSSGSRDSAVIVDLPPGSYSVQVRGAANTTGLALVELYDISTENAPSVSVSASVSTTDTLNAQPAVFTVTRTGSTATPLTVYFEFGGSALPGIDYQSLPASLTIPAGASSANLSVKALPKDIGVGITPNKTVTVDITNGPAYIVSRGASATATIFYNPGTLYASSLRVPAGVTGSTAAGSSILQLSTDNAYAIVSVNFSGLSSPQTVAYLRYGDPGQVGVDLVRLPNGQVSSYQWTLRASGTLSTSDIVQGIKDGRVYLAIETANLPTGELRGSYLRTNGSLAFVPPAPPPALPLNPLTAAEASRFLTQATFGGTKDEIDALTGRSLADLNVWITDQMARPASSHDAATDTDFDTFTKPSGNSTLSQTNRQAAWWNIAVNGPDQLRQRVAFALSQILVVSEINAVLLNQPAALATYYDLLVKNAFGNFRTLIEDVSVSPAMGIYLSHLRNAKATFNNQGVQLTFPDENYAREIMQLFTIGIVQLHPDGTLKLDPTGTAIPTYDQKTITEMAKVFTGWGYSSTAANPSFRGATANYLRPMQMYPEFHDISAKTIVGGVVLPANQTGVQDLKDALDTLFLHPNTGPFLARQLIQRMVTSNPSPGYIYRVARAFDDNGAGVRGDLGAVVRAVLLDYEARSATVAESASFGKLREPVLRVTGLLRSLRGGSNSGRVPLFSGNTDSSLAQTPLRAPTVFNFYEPNYVQPGTLASAGLFAPEYQILNDTTAMTVPNLLWTYLYSNRAVESDTDNQTLGIRFDASMLSLANTPQALADYMNLTLASGSLPKATTDRIVTAVSAMPATSEANRRERVRSTAYLTLISPNGAIQK